MDSSVLEAVKQAVNSPLLETSIEGAENLLINTSGKVNIISLNEAISYVRELAGSKVNIIWGTVTQENYDEGKIVVTLIATGMSKEKENQAAIKRQTLMQNQSVMEKSPMMQNQALMEKSSIIQRTMVPEPKLYDIKLAVPKKEQEIVIPPFLQEMAKRGVTRMK